MLKRVFVVVAALFAAAALVVAILTIINARDPYGGPIEPAAEH